MSTYNGPWIATDDWRSVMDVTTTSTNTAVSFTVVGKCQSVYTYNSNWQGTLTSNGTGGTNSTTFSCNTNQTVTFKTNTFSVARGTSAKAVTIKCSVYNPSYGSTSTATTTVNVSALASYAVTYNANGGSGAPSSQTKWYGSTLTLSSTVPTRTNYTFLGWATSSTATTATYQPSGSYTANAAVTLYAVWQLALVPPEFGGTTVYRTSGSGSTRDEEGANAYLSVAWSVDTATNGAGNKGQTLAIEYRARGASAWTSAKSVALNTASATTTTNLISTTSTLISFDGGTSYDIRLTLTDTAGTSASKTLTLSQTFFLIDAYQNGDVKSLGFGMAASEGASGIGFGELPPTFSDASAWLSALGISYGSSSTSAGTWKWLKLPNGLAIAEYVDTNNRTVACTSQTGGTYWGTVYSIDLPFTFASVPQLNCSPSGNNNYFVQISAGTTTATGNIYLCRSSSSTFTGKIHVTAIGRYE